MKSENRAATHPAVWFQEAPSSILEEIFRIVVNCFHDFRPVQTLNSFCIFYVTRATEIENVSRKSIFHEIRWKEKLDGFWMWDRFWML